MEDALITILTGLSAGDVYRQGSLDKDAAYPSHFWTFWNADSPDHAYYDNRNYGTAWAFTVYYYSEDPAETYSMIDAARNALKENGWICPSRGYDVLSDEPTHTGRGLDVFYLETVTPTPEPEPEETTPTEEMPTEPNTKGDTPGGDPNQTETEPEP